MGRLGSLREHLPKVVIIEKTNHNTQKVGRTILFTHELSLEPMLLIKYYSLRLQIEFDFRNAKQFLDFQISKITNKISLLMQ